MFMGTNGKKEGREGGKEERRKHDPRIFLVQFGSKIPFSGLI